MPPSLLRAFDLHKWQTQASVNVNAVDHVTVASLSISQRMDETPILSVEFSRLLYLCYRRFFSVSNLSLVLSYVYSDLQNEDIAGIPFALSMRNKTKIGFPGWPEPNLDWDSGFGGSVLEKGGLHQPPFSFPDG
jgi:hypothetical protein